MFGIDDLALGLIVGGAISAAGGVASSAMSASSASASNKESYKYTDLLQTDQQKFNASEAEKARQFNASEAAKARQWQADMSNSAYQRAMADMRAAGLNPLLAATNGGASSGSGATASASPATSSSGSVSAKSPDFSGISSASNQIARMFEVYPQMVESQSRTKLNEQSAKLSAAQTAKELAQAHKTELEAASIEPEIIKENRRKGNTDIGKHALDFQRFFTDGWNDFKADMRDLFSSSSSAKGSVVLPPLQEASSAKSLKTSVDFVGDKLEKVIKRAEHERGRYLAPRHERDYKKSPIIYNGHH